MNTIEIFLIFIGIIFLLIFLISLAIFFAKKKEILSFLHPDRWVEVTIIQLDDSITRDLTKKNEDLTYEFNGLDYNLYYPDRKSPDGDKSLTKSVVFRSGRLASFTYLEGQVDPLDFRDLSRSYSVDTKIKKEMAKSMLTRLVSSMNQFNQVFNKYWWVFLIAGLLLVILLTRKPQVVITPETIQAMKGG